MKEPKKIPLSDHVKKEPKKIRLWPDDDKILDDILEDENYKQNNSQSIQQLESESSN